MNHRHACSVCDTHFECDSSDCVVVEDESGAASCDDAMPCEDCMKAIESIVEAP